MQKHRGKLADKVLDLMKLVRDRPMTVHEITADSGLHIDTVREWTATLTDQGFLTRVKRDIPREMCGRFPYEYTVSPAWRSDGKGA